MSSQTQQQHYLQAQTNVAQQQMIQQNAHPTQQQLQQQLPQTVSQQDCPILIWMLSLNREYSREEYDQCYSVVRDCVPHVNIPHDPRNAESFRQLITQMLPLLMMRHRRIPRSQWQDMATNSGKHWIQQHSEHLPPEKFMSSMIGYHLTIEESLCGMAMTQGQQRKVINIGLGIKQIEVQPKGITVAAYLESMSHKLTPNELSMMTPDLGDEVILRRLCIVLAFKQAYIKAIGQPIGFDWSRLEINLPAEKAYGDGVPLSGWEFRIFKSKLGVARTSPVPPPPTTAAAPSGSRAPQPNPASGAPQIRDIMVEESYQCVCAFFRGTRETVFMWQETQKQIETWVQYLTIDQMIKVIPKLRA